MTNATIAAGSARSLAGLGLLLTAFVWGTMVPVTAALLETVDPMMIAAVRYSLSVPALWLGTIALDRAGRTDWGCLPWGRIFLLGGAGMAAFAVCLSFGIHLSDPITTAAIFATSPALAALVSWALDGRRPRPILWLTIALTVIGGLIAALYKHESVKALGFRGGEILLLVGVVLWIWYSMKAQSWLKPYGLSQIRITMLTGGAAALWLWAIYGIGMGLGLSAPPSAAISTLTILELIWLGIGPTALGVLLWNNGIAKLNVSVAALYVNLAPVFAVIISVVALGSQTTAMQLLGGAIVLASVVYMQLYGLRRSL
jgi:drug/metabolite transporter (DMT)-like permease